ncbi:MAG: aminotransferase class V-fold PLP-dependent enzyme [Pirellulales bacterium]|nr:aminotransferase class V-fold PLP-dependent enzyme [Pirellulales bacterium]
MVLTPVYMDNHSTTRVDPRVVEAMIPLFHDVYGNPGSVNHVFGWDAAAFVKEARQSIADLLNAKSSEIGFTSGATESNNLAIRGVLERKRRRGNHIVSIKTEHHAVLDPLDRLSRNGYEITLLDVDQYETPTAGRIDLDSLTEAIRTDTCLVSVMLANNEIGVVQDIAAIGEICKRKDVLFHCDATQAVGRVLIDVQHMKVDLLSISAHKFYGPKGIGALFVRKRSPNVRLEPLVTGGGQENGLRSGTVNPAGIVGMATAMQIAVNEMAVENRSLYEKRNRLYTQLAERIPDLVLNGPSLKLSAIRLPNNLNISFSNVDGEALMMSMRELAVSSGSACSSTNPEPSHVLRSIGLSDDMTRASLRFGLGRFNTEDEIDFAIELVTRSVSRLRTMKSG